MQILKLYAEIQANPNNKEAYRQLAQHYKEQGKINEAEAFLELIRRKFDADSPFADQKQRQNDH